MSLLPSRPDAEPAEDAGPRVIGVDDDDADDVLAALSSGTARSLLSSLHEEPATPSELAERVDTSLQNVQYHLEKLAGAGAVEVVETAYSAKGREMDVYAPADQPLVIFAGDEERGSTLRTALSRLLGGLGVLAVASAAVQSIYGETDLLPGLGADDGAPSGGSDGAAPPPGDGNGAGGNGGADGADEDAGSLSTETRTEETETPVAQETPAEDADTPVAEATPTPAESTPDAAGTPSPTETETVVSTETPPSTDTPVPTDVPDVTPAPEAADAVAGSGLPPGLLFFAGGLFVLVVLVVALYVWED